MIDRVLINGLWVPAGDMQLINGLQQVVKARKRPVIDGRVAWRYDRIEAVLAFLPPERRRVAIDVGAHIGMWARWLAKDFKRTICYEPVQRHLDCLYLNLFSDYGRVKVYEQALGDYRGSMGVHIEREVSGRSYMSDKGVGTLVDTLDSFELCEIDFIKIDVEGYELKVITGAKETIFRNRPVIVIEQLGHEARYSEPRNSALSLLREWGMVELRSNMKGDYYMGWP